MAVDNNNDGIDDVTGQPIVPDFGSIGAGGSYVDTGAPSGYNAVSETGPGGNTVTTLTPDQNRDPGAWYPRPTPVNPYFTSGTVGSTASALADPNSGMYYENISTADLNGAENLPQSNMGLFEIVAKGRKTNQSASTILNSFIATSAYYNAHGVRISPQQLAYQEALDNGWITDTGKANVPTDPGPYRGPTTQYNLTNAGDAEATLNQMMSSYLGRQVKPGEVAQFKKRLNAVEMANPTVSTPMGDHASVTTGGSNPAVEARDFAMSRGDYAETTASTTLFGWLTDAVRGSGSERIV